MLQCVVVMLLCVAVCCSVLQDVAVCCSVLQCVAVMLQCVAVCCIGTIFQTREREGGRARVRERVCAHRNNLLYIVSYY